MVISPPEAGREYLRKVAAFQHPAERGGERGLAHRRHINGHIGEKQTPETQRDARLRLAYPFAHDVHQTEPKSVEWLRGSGENNRMVDSLSV